MPSSYAYWENLFAGDATRIRKALYGSFLVRDYRGPATALTNFSPFDPETGNLRGDLLVPVSEGGQGWFDVGLLDENGVQFSPKYTTADVMAWQNRMAQRTDVTLDQEECAINCIQSDPLIDRLNYQMPLTDPTTGAPIIEAVGTAGYQLTKSNVPVLATRQILAIGVDGSSGDAEFFGTMYTRAQMIKPDKYDYQAKTEVQTSLTFDSYPCPFSGFAVRRFREGPAWRAAGGTTTWAEDAVAPVATAGPSLSATITFAPPVSDNGPFTYKVTVNDTPVDDSKVTVVSATSSEVTLKVTDLTAGSAVFRVIAVGVNKSMSTPTAATNSVTIAS